MTFALWGVPLNVTASPQHSSLLDHDELLSGVSFGPSSRCFLASGQRVAILGASVSVGCGAIWPSHRCQPVGSWGYVMHSRLLLEHGATHVDLSCRNSVTLSYFTQCASRFHLDGNTNVVLLEGEPAMVMAPRGTTLAAVDVVGIARDLCVVVAQLRRFAPNALYAFVGWPPLSFLRRNVTEAVRWERELVRHTHALDPSIHFAFAAPLLQLAALRAAGVSELGRERDSQHAADDAHARRRWHARSLVAGTTTSALHAGDSVHPNAAGHRLMGEIAAALITEAVRRGRSRACVGAHGAVHETSRLTVDRSQQLAADPAAAGATAAESTVDWCYMSAPLIPVARPLAHGITLRDEGGDKGVQKLGFVSEIEGATLSIGPLVPEVRCALLEASVGYLQSWRRTQGAFRIECVGSCACAGVPGSWSAASDPYPLVQTTIPTARDAQGKDTHAFAKTSLTVFTRFFLWKRVPSPPGGIRNANPPGAGQCLVNLIHTSPAGRASSSAPTMNGNGSRIRIDAFGLKLAGCQASCALSHYPQTKRLASMARSECASGFKAGLPGFLSPACFNRSMHCSVLRNSPEYY